MKKIFICKTYIDIMTTISIYPVTRIEADGKLILHVNDENVIEKGYFYPYMPVRGFARMLIGKTLDFLPVSAMRICGVCHATHGIAAIEAAERALNIEPPEAGLYLREIIGLGNRLQSHTLHMLFLYKDFFKGDKDILKQVFEMMTIASEIVKISGHTSIHPSNLCVGGVFKNVSDKGKEEMMKLARDYVNSMKDFEEKFKDKLIKMVEENIIPENLGNVKLPLLSTHPYYGDSNRIDLLDLTVVPPEKYYRDNKIIDETGTSLATYKNEITEVGPKARMTHFFSFRCNLPLSINIAYMEDALKGAQRIIDLCDELNTNAKTRSYGTHKNGKGIGVHEAPRGTNIHVLNVREDGIILNYRIIVPTMFNIPVIDTALAGTPVEFAELIVRSYDPCLSCSTHVTVIKNGKVEGRVIL